MRVYLDHNATTPVREEVAAAMGAVLREQFGNPSSVHAEGAAARTAVERARESLASLLGCAPRELFFTAGATEANNTALGPLLRAWAGDRREIVSSSVEHPSVEEPLAALERAGWRVTRVPVSADGLLDPAALEVALGPQTALLTLLWANNETGVVQPMRRIVELARARGVRVHADATQCLGKLAIDWERDGLAALSLSAHKFGGPKGVGALVVREAPEFEPLLRGGPQERRRRGGTENVPGIVGLGVAAALAARELPERIREYARLRDRLWDGIAGKIPRVRRNGAPEAVLLQHAQPGIRRRRGRAAASGARPRRHRRERGRCVRFGRDRALARPAGDGAQRSAGAGLAALQRRRGRRRWPDRARARAAAGPGGAGARGG